MNALCGSVVDQNTSEDFTSAIQQQIWGIIQTLQSRQKVRERRRSIRYPFPHLIQLFPVDPCGNYLDSSITVVGKNLSTQGLDFYHPSPLPYRRMVACLESGPCSLAYLIDISWCRFLRQGWYESGGRFLEAKKSPLKI